MPIPTSQRHSRPNSPLRTPHPRQYARGLRTSATVTQGAHPQKLNVVTRVAIEGKAKHGEDGAGIKMYLKISLPLDSITPGSTIPLFPEESVKILSSQVHPLDNNSTLKPLCAVPSRSSESYDAAFGLSPPTTSASVSGSVRSNGSSSSRNATHRPSTANTTGHILVSGYHISYVLPKAFPARYQDSDAYSRPSGSLRRSSMVERNSVQFMAAIDMWVPYASRPPRSPFLLSIPTPRCLHNKRATADLPLPPPHRPRLRRSLPQTRRAGRGDLTSDPHSRSGTYSYGNVADDESSDSSTTGFSDGCGIQGTFPSAERIRVRWAKPTKIVGGGGDGRRRVGVKDVKGEMTCAVLGKMRDPEHQREGVLMHVEYKGTCKGVWFPGVATMLGMDVSLEAKGWAGGAGYTGHDSLDSNYSNGPPFLSAERPPSGMASRQSSQSSTSSLLRQPLPANNVPEYSFEGAPSSSVSASQTTSIDSSVGSLLPSTPHWTLHTALPASKNTFPFWISGTVLVTPRAIAPRSAPSRGSSPIRGEHEPDSPPLDPESIVIPRFTVLAADNESVSIIVRNEVHNSTQGGESYQRSPAASKTILHRGEYAKCAERTRIAVKSAIVFASSGAEMAAAALAPTGNCSLPAALGRRAPRQRRAIACRRLPRACRLLGMVPSRPKRDGVLMIPSVVATVTHWSSCPRNASSRLAAVPAAYAVRVCLAAPVDSESDWLEFGLAKHGAGNSSAAVGLGPPKVDVVSVSVDDVPVSYEATVAVKQEESAVAVGLPFEQMSGQEWVSWVKLHVGAAGGGRVVVDYVVTDVGGLAADRKGKMKARDETQFDVYLPSFGIPVGRLEVNIDGISGLEISSLQSNFTHHQIVGSGRRLLHYALQPFFYPHISLDIRLNHALLAAFCFVVGGRGSNAEATSSDSGVQSLHDPPQPPPVPPKRLRPFQLYP
ncbi:hypothetical protein C8J57DRAFT_1664164 [Mycena rebaudengoi]|nr:hypothetical protein C8J57DRAFT_1664164 [Mycena rebaudengoi]